MAGFYRACPEYDVRIDATDRQANFAKDNVDIALRYGQGHYPGLCSECLLAEFTFPVCSPALTGGQYPLRRPQDLRHYTLLHALWRMQNEAAPSWRMWLRAAGVDGVDAERGPQFSQESMVVQAAITGQGVALAPAALVTEELAQGQLVRPFPDAADQPSRFCYYLVYPESYLQRAKVAAFRNWAMSEAEQSKPSAQWDGG